MSDSGFGAWMSIESAPRDGTRILAGVKASEQGPAEVDVVRWAIPDRAGEACWISTESDPDCRIIYVDGELTGWMPLPSPVPALRSRQPRQDRSTSGSASEEIAGSGI